jgi:hypothetical protein
MGLRLQTHCLLQIAHYVHNLCCVECLAPSKGPSVALATSGQPATTSDGSCRLSSDAQRALPRPILKQWRLTNWRIPAGAARRCRPIKWSLGSSRTVEYEAWPEHEMAAVGRPDVEEKISTQPPTALELCVTSIGHTFRIPYNTPPATRAGSPPTQRQKLELFSGIYLMGKVFIYRGRCSHSCATGGILFLACFLINLCPVIDRPAVGNDTLETGRQGRS